MSGVEILCVPVPEDPPQKSFGPPECPCAQMWVTKKDGYQTMRIRLQPEFDWRKYVKPILPGEPDWCPVTHFGYLESGSMEIKMQDGTSKTIKAGESYLVSPGHIPVIKEPTVMVEFTQDSTYANMKD